MPTRKGTEQHDAPRCRSGERNNIGPIIGEGVRVERLRPSPGSAKGGKKHFLKGNKERVKTQKRFIRLEGQAPKRVQGARGSIRGLRQPSTPENTGKQMLAKDASGKTGAKGTREPRKDCQIKVDRECWGLRRKVFRQHKRRGEQG